MESHFFRYHPFLL